MINLAIPSIVVLIASLSYLTKVANLQDFIGTLESFAINITGVVFLVLYFLTIYYAVLNNQTLRQALKQTFKLTIKKFYKYIPLYFPLFLNTVLIMWFLAIGIMQQYTSTDFFSPVLFLLGVVFTLTISIFYKILIQKIVEKEK